MSELTYPARLVGTSVERREGEHRATIGRGRADFVKAAEAVMRWEVKTRAGFRVHSTKPATLGRELVITLGPLTENVRVVRIVNEPRLRGFAYGTLRRHPLRGEEAFLIEWRDDDTVDLVIRAFSRPNGFWWTLASPVTAVARQVFIRRYLRALLD